MKITLFLLLFATFQAYSSNSYSQSAKISIPRTNLKVSELLSKIESQTEYLFVYNKKNVDTHRTVNIDADNKPVSEVLDEAFEGTNIKYVMEGKNIVLTKNAESIAATQQSSNISIKGTITDVKGEPIIGANVLEKGTTNGSISDMDGHFNLSVPSNATLIISYIGYLPQTINVNGQTTFNIQMQEEALTLDQVVVTAMGIKKKASSLTYSNQQVDGDELTRAKDPNMINALAGKTAGVQISRSSSGLGGSAKVAIRGARSLSGNNQPLYVIDGVPMLNNSNEQASTAMGGTADAGNRDGGDGISNLNPDDIESMSILKGASAAALYGSQAANGVILITTKKGKAGIQRITVSSNITFDQAISLPEFQNEYGRDANGRSWGEKGSLKDYNNVDNFFQGGVTAINSITLARGNDKVQTYFSYANTYGKGLIEGNKLMKHNLNFRETASFFNDRLTLDGNVNLMQQTLKNRPTTGGYYMNPLVGVYGFPRGQDLGEYKTHFETFDKGRNMPVQNWHTAITGFDQNPYWITNRITSDDKRTRAIANLSANVKINDWFSVQARGTADFISDKYTQKMYATTAAELSGSNGRYINLDHTEMLVYGDVMAMFNKTWNNWSVNAALGSSINSTNVNSLRLDSKIASLYYPNQFTVANINMSTNAYINERIDEKRVLQSVFATAQIGWKESLYLDVTARNDWSSTLAYTKSASKGFFYPSVGLSWIINNTVKLPDWISFGKIRGSWSQVGNDLPLFISNPVDIITAGGGLQANDRAPFDELKPELSSSFEIGTEWKFFNQRLDLDFTYYKSSTKNQLLTLPSSAGAVFKYYMVNAGQIDNSGIELTVGVTPVMNDNFRWKSSVNFSANKNKVVELHPDLKAFIYGDENFSMSYSMRLKEGGSFGDIYGVKYARDEQGNIKMKVDDKGVSTGKPDVIGTGNTEYIGNSSPDYMLGWSNTFTYKGFTLYFLLDARVGGDVLSMTQAELDYRGVSKVAGDARNAGFVMINGQKFDDVYTFYDAVGARNACITENYMYDATNIRLRELSLSYSVPQSILHKMNVFQGIDISFVGRNLFFIYKKAPFDPDAVMSTGNSVQGIDVFGMPTTRSLGFNVKFTF